MERASPKSNSLSVQTTLEKTVGKEAKEAIEAMQAQYEEPMQVLEEQLIEADEKVKVAEKKLIAAEQKAETQLAAGTAMLTIEHDNFVKKCAEQTANAEAVSNAAEAKLVETLEELSRLEALQETPSTAAEVEQLKHALEESKTIEQELKRLLEAAPEATRQLAAVQSEAAEQAAEKQAVEDECNALKDQAKEAEAKMDKQKEQLELLQSEVAQLKVLLAADAGEVVAQLQEETSQKTAQVAELKSNLKNHVKAVDAEIGEYLIQISDLQLADEVKAAEIGVLEAELAEAQVKLDKLLSVELKARQADEMVEMPGDSLGDAAIELLAGVDKSLEELAVLLEADGLVCECAALRMVIGQWSDTMKGAELGRMLVIVLEVRKQMAQRENERLGDVGVIANQMQKALSGHKIATANAVKIAVHQALERASCELFDQVFALQFFV